MEDKRGGDELPDLTEDNLQVELEGLREDMLNWDYGHTITVKQPQEI